MNYQITITKTEPNPNFAEDLKVWQTRREWNMERGQEPRRDFVKDALICELTEEQFKAVKAAVLQEFS